MASAEICSAIGPCTGCAACTVTTVSGAAAFLQPGKDTSSSAAAAASTQLGRTRLLLRGVLCFVVLLITGSLISDPCSSHRSRDRLQGGSRGFVANASVLTRVFRAYIGIFRVYHFQYHGLAT